MEGGCVGPRPMVRPLPDTVVCTRGGEEPDQPRDSEEEDSIEDGEGVRGEGERLQEEEVEEEEEEEEGEG